MMYKEIFLNTLINLLVRSTNNVSNQLTDISQENGSASRHACGWAQITQGAISLIDLTFFMITMEKDAQLNNYRLNIMIIDIDFVWRNVNLNSNDI